MSRVLSDLRESQTSEERKNVGKQFYGNWRYKDLIIMPTKPEMSSYILELFLNLLLRYNQAGDNCK